MTDQNSAAKRHPINNVQWVDPNILRANDYNPNRVFSPEMQLLKTSILEDGWTQPIVARPSGEIVDGFHRWTLGSTDPDIKAVSGGLVPVVYMEPVDKAHQILSTVRHNRARGSHSILKMGQLTKELSNLGLADEDIQARMGMEEEEVNRLLDLRTSPERVGKDSFGRGWVPLQK